MADIYKEKQWELDSAIDDLYAVASRYEDYKNAVNRFIDSVIDDEIAYKDESNKLQKRIDKAIKHLELFIGDPQLRKYDTLKILTYTRDILKGSDKE